ncbi:transposase [Aquicoccus sp. SCR17]|nr:transposase [Carideicomes alvinocaridis]
MRGEILGVERRRRWSDDQKLSIVASVGVNRATVAHVAQRHEITRSQIYSWRRELKHKGLLPEDEPARFLSLPPVQAAPPQGGGDGIGSDDLVEIVLRGDRRLRVPAGLGDAALARLIRVTEAA